MIYILESKVPDNKSIHIGLRNVYGVGLNKALFICKKLGFSINLKVKHLSSDQVSQISKLAESLNFIFGSDLKKFKLLRKQYLLNIKCYRGLRRKKGFPVRGQRTHTNARTAKKIK